VIVRELPSEIIKEISEEEYKALKGSYVFSKALAYAVSDTLLDYKELQEDYTKLQAHCGK
jgi:hypothetical protein